jgi:rSAM/selenodomain-associated transferase 2
MISVIVPTLNEAAELPRTLEALRRNQEPHETIVVDAGSSDGTPSLASASGCRLVKASEPHRARQLNLGARESTGEILLFLHADTRLRPDSLAAITRALSDLAVAGGAFARRFECPSPWLQLTAWLADFRGRWWGWHFGDQAMFARRTAVDSLGGFADLPLFEDLDFSRRLARLGQVRTLRPPISSSGRRFAARGPLRTTLADFWLTCRYALGADPCSLAARPPCPAKASGPTGQA